MFQFMVNSRVMRGRWSRSFRALYSCGTARKHKNKVPSIIFYYTTIKYLQLQLRVHCFVVVVFSYEVVNFIVVK